MDKLPGDDLIEFIFNKLELRFFTFEIVLYLCFENLDVFGGLWKHIVHLVQVNLLKCLLISEEFGFDPDEALVYKLDGVAHQVIQDQFYLLRICLHLNIINLWIHFRLKTYLFVFGFSLKRV